MRIRFLCFRKVGRHESFYHRKIDGVGGIVGGCCSGRCSGVFSGIIAGCQQGGRKEEEDESVHRTQK